MAEWVADGYQAGFYSHAPERNPVAEGPFKVVRGGSWASDANKALATHRRKASPGDSSSEIGFRCARSVEPPK